MKKRALFIYPPSELINREDRCQVPSKNITIAPPLPPTDLIYLAAMGEKAGYECRIVDYTLDRKTVSDLIRDIREFSPQLLVMSITTPTIASDLALCCAIKKAAQGISIIAKGAHFLRFNTAVLEEVPDLDMIIRGEPEITFYEIATGVEKKDIKGLTWRGLHGPLNNPDRPFLEDLDSLPFPARHLVDNNRYRRPDNNRVQAIIKVARGCPYHCFFCLATPVSGAKVRMRSPDNILEEVKICIERYGIRDFLFWSDIFNVDKKWVTQLAEAIIASGLKFTWAANTRADTIDLETARLLRKAGCALVSVGIESGSQEILDKMGKVLRIEEIKKSFEIFKKAGLKTFAYYIIGLPWDTRETVEKTIRLAVELDSDYANFFTATAFPGTRFFEYALENGLFGDDVTDVNRFFQDAYYVPTVRSHYLTKDEIVALHRKAVKTFYLRPSYIIKRIAGIRSPAEILNHMKAAWGLLKGGA